MSKKYQDRDDTNRSHKITFRLSDDEYEHLNIVCEVLNLTYSQYLRRAALTARIDRPVVQTALDKETSQKLTAQFGKIGSNLNQIARKLNGGAEKENELLVEISDRLSDLHKQLLNLNSLEDFDGNSETSECK